MFFRPPHLLCMVLWIGSLLPGSFGAAPAQAEPEILPTPDDVSNPNNFSVDSTTSQTSINWIQGRGSTFSSRISSTFLSQGLPSDLASPAADQNPALMPRAESSDPNSMQNPQNSIAAQNLAARTAVPGAKGNGAAAATPTSLDYNVNIPPKETSSKNKRELVPIIFLNGNDDEDDEEAPASTTKLKHGSDPHKGEDYCQDDEGKKYKTAPRPTPSKAYSPCWFVAPATPTPYSGGPSKTTTITDPKGTVWFCPSATPNDLAVHSEYDCGPHSSSLSVIPSIVTAWSAAQATATANSKEVVGEVLFALAWGHGTRTSAWAVWPLHPKEIVDPCKVHGLMPDKKGAMYTDIQPFDVPFPPSMPSLEDIKIGDLSLAGCQYINHEKDRGTLKCSSYKEFECVKARYEGMQYRCNGDTIVPKVNCKITAGNKQ